MNSRITIDLGDSRLFSLLKVEAARRGVPMKELVTEALNAYFSHHQENISLLKMAEKTFSEWNDPKNSDYDSL